MELLLFTIDGAFDWRAHRPRSLVTDVTPTGMLTAIQHGCVMNEGVSRRLLEFVWHSWTPTSVVFSHTGHHCQRAGLVDGDICSTLPVDSYKDKRTPVII